MILHYTSAINSNTTCVHSNAELVWLLFVVGSFLSNEKTKLKYSVLNQASE